ncbi:MULTISPECIES: ABC transporter ATP-binding protein [Glutamicibacter]|uniref:ABC transporter ATP-binding protein n=1 Tax=Glutamicibacter halophytocola TaxID=1933880 RepID=A0A5B8I3Y2_9MICC|nr:MULTISPECIES: ATP-binding cassette domain-containing protein [Glutamicibacter]ALG30603.1 dipeptide/oligopeptide/nickel ABC transporter ATP-binding protein [Glutamicibacter halophytocola]MBF6673165.1 ABC transporter ATP-binding protein [Glutamicibacter sp. FBE19]NQD40164.1 ABC transporter ATP-binding protein [Glutamicibacter halophytocola]QDY66856.1 ABC transporter ATP-binding protein [Glutamicibacter halophytocola]UUX58997.1 ATP-binding cassette domain-containing protein [Glutamicibacter ha
MTSVRVENLSKDYTLRGGLKRRTLRAVDRVSFELSPGKTVALVGESGSGKSTIAKLLTRMEKPSSGSIEVLDGQQRQVADAHYRRHLQMVFQDPFASLNPFHSIEHHLARPLRIHQRTAGKGQTYQRVLQMLERVNLEPAGQIAAKRPHELSGGQRQRVAIARALAPGAQVLIADEPVSMLDVSIRLGVLNLLARLQREDQLAVLYITHDLATARHFSDEILVLYKGRIVERGPSDEVILNPQHDYTRLLAQAAPDPERVGQVLNTGLGVDRARIDNTNCFNHFTGGWEQLDRTETQLPAAHR